MKKTIILLGALLISAPAEAKCHRVWNYPYPQHCGGYVHHAHYGHHRYYGYHRYAYHRSYRYGHTRHYWVPATVITREYSAPKKEAPKIEPKQEAPTEVCRGNGTSDRDYAICMARIELRIKLDKEAGK